MTIQRNRVSRRLITPSAWGKKDAFNAQTPADERQCKHCSRRGLHAEHTIAGQMFRCPACKTLQF
jgi:hypothetical protein